jgi:poly-beta-1,6-N-acetyl-D-glucosamine biosynthesis protein PgaD
MPVINRPELKRFRQKALESTVMALGTLVLKVVLIGFTLALWGFSFGYVTDRLFAPDALTTTVRMLLFLIGFALAAFLIMLAWAKYNIFWYAKKDRRQTPPPLTPQMMAAYYNTDLDFMTAAATCKVGTVEMSGGELVFCDDKTCFPIREFGK